MTWHPVLQVNPRSLIFDAAVSDGLEHGVILWVCRQTILLMEHRQYLRVTPGIVL